MDGSSVLTFQYNQDGIRTSKTVDGVKHTYLLSGSQIVGETWGNHLLIFLYDESGSPIGMQYRNSNYDSYDFDTFYFEKNLQGDIVAVYNEDGEKVLGYTYDAWGNHTLNWYSIIGNDLLARYNPFRYRGYYYDTETELYYLQSRYYDPYAGRFLNADGYVNANGDLVGFNMYAYCSNNPIRFIDPCGGSITDWLWNFLYGNPEKQEETQQKLEYIKNKIVRDMRDIWDCITWDFGLGFGLGGTLSVECYEGTIMLRQDIFTIQKRTGENPMFGMASDVYTSLVVGELFNTGKGTRELWPFIIGEGTEPRYREQVDEIPGYIHPELGGAGYFIIGATSKVGFDVTEYVNRKYQQWQTPDPYNPWKN